MPEKKNVLIFPAGSEIGLEIYRSLRYNLHVDVYGASGKSDHAKFVYPSERYEEGPYFINSLGFLSAFNDLLSRWKIDFIYPTHDTIALWLAENEHLLKAKVITSPYETTQIARSKKQTYDLFKDCDFCPKVFKPPFTEVTRPVFLKPDDGQGGKGAFVASNQYEAMAHFNRDPNLVVCELLPGEELSVDCFTNRHGKLLFVGPRTRERVQMGISFNSKRVTLSNEILRIADLINGMVTIRGAWFFQIKKDSKGEYKLLEFAVRQASTMGLYRQAGVNFALLSLFDKMDYEVSILDNGYFLELERCLSNKYKINYSYNKVYIDFDDTIVVNEKVNLEAIKYIYDCRNRGISIFMITKHLYDLDETLVRYAIPKNLFDSIIHLKMEEEKFKHIDKEGSIFIDNHFLDRAQVHKELGIPVFDVDAIESLI
jgi:hypothetical protein